jgi:hypothetical protein
MRFTGVLLLVGGIIGLLLALNMNTSVATEQFNLETLSYVRVNNLGLMNQKQGYLIAAGVVSVVGAMTTLFSLGRD